MRSNVRFPYSDDDILSLEESVNHKVAAPIDSKWTEGTILIIIGDKGNSFPLLLLPNATSDDEMEDLR